MAVIEIVNLKKQYAGKYVLQGINLSIDAGQVVGYIGPNGAGKSTTIKIIAGITDEFEGDVSVFGMDVRRHALEIKQRIGYIPEQAAIYDVLTPIEYLRFIGRLYGLSEEVIGTKSWELLRLFELSDKAETRMNTYSKGMKQKVLLISGLIHNPEIIFLDEPLSGLDANAVILVKEILSQLKQSGKTIFYSSHIMDVVEKISDRIVIIDKGAVVADGSFESLQQQAHQGTLENIFTSLTGGDQQNTSTAKEFINVLNS
ncbi:ABC transporter ATP-binding protein [Ferruginibacter sp. HRS2-29]|uniref:ABC transporter ATP-binding protein n=1 Tax=Ferruginibacter sp. HRS2-29 TaxID=2487334 RepID=UPI0020CF62E9|nr:ABC transporter ATP-binding protein [Ferruginibacter sp. HRS2-29]MCP9749855.1 ABC transporter ATP-binding protein [Ferruginibacter sp. HRS2-29]